MCMSRTILKATSYNLPIHSTYTLQYNTYYLVIASYLLQTHHSRPQLPLEQVLLHEVETHEVIASLKRNLNTAEWRHHDLQNINYMYWQLHSTIT